jgi:two-component system response regulator NreC
LAFCPLSGFCQLMATGAPMTHDVLTRGPEGPRVERLSAPAGPVSIALAYQGAMVRSALKLLLDDVPDFEVVAEAEDLEGAMRYVNGHRPRVLVLDLELGRPDSSAISAISEIRASLPETEVVVISHNESLMVREAIGAGAVGCVCTTSPADHLTEAVRRAGCAEAYLSAEILAAIVRSPSAAPDGLSSREVQIIGLIAMGYTTAEIAELLFVSVRTVESHRASVQLKLGRPTRAELVAYALGHGITECQAVIGAVRSHPHQNLA